MEHDGMSWHNVAELEERPGMSGLLIRRWPKHVADEMGHRGCWIAQQCVAVELRFVSDDAPVRIFLTPLQSVRVVVYRGEVVCDDQQFAPGAMQTLMIEQHERMRGLTPGLLEGAFSEDLWRVQIYGTCVYNGIDTFGRRIRPPTRDELPQTRWLAYGSSITHGSPDSYVMQAARRLGWDVRNMGMSGSCACEPAVAEYLAEQDDFEICTLELGINMRGGFTPEQFADRAGNLVEAVTSAHEAVPVIIITIFPNSFGHLVEPNATSEKEAVFNEILREIVRDCDAPHCYLIEGSDILTDLRGLRSDILHPSWWGSIEMGANLAKYLPTFAS